MSSLATLRTTTRGLYLRIDPNGKIRSNDVLDSAINDGYMEVQKAGGNNRREQQDSGTFTTTSWTNTYSLPSDFLKFSSLSYNDLAIGKTYKEDVAMTNQSTNTGVPYAYYIYGANIGFYPIPNTAGTVTYLYNKRLSTITSGVDSSLPADFDFAICLHAAYVLCGGVEKFPKAQRLLDEFEKKIGTLLYQYTIDSSDYTYKLDRWVYVPSARSLY